MGTHLSRKMGHVLLLEDANPLHAHLIAGALADAGLDCVVEEDNLWDEAAMPRKLMGVQGNRIWVPEAQATEAQAVFLSMSQPIPIIDEDDAELEAYAEEIEGRQNRALGWMVFLAFLLPSAGLAVYLLADRLGWFNQWGLP